MTKSLLPALPDPIATGTMTSSDVLQFIRYVALLDLRLPPIQLPTLERMKLGGHLFPAGLQIALRVAQALRWAPSGLFDEYDLHPGDLHDCVLRALHLRTLAHLLRTLAQRADDLALLDESSATLDAMRVVRPALPVPPVPGSFLDRRRLYLGPALLAWEHYQRRLKQTRAKK